MHRILLGIAMVLVAACGGAETGGGTSSSSSSAAATSSAAGSGGGGSGGTGGQGGAGGSAAVPVEGESRTIKSCAPDDGTAFTIEIGLPQATCDAAQAGPLLRISFYTHVDAPAGNTFVISQEITGDGQAIFNPGGDPSNLIFAKNGTLTVDTWDTASATGGYDIIFTDGTHLAGTFNAVGCLTNSPMCG
jgi:hypothetical protein